MPVGMKQIAQVAADDDVIHEAFAFSDNGAQLAHVRTDTKGKTQLHVGPARRQDLGGGHHVVHARPGEDPVPGRALVRDRQRRRPARRRGRSERADRKRDRRVRRLLHLRPAQDLRDGDRQRGNVVRPRLQHRRLPAERRASRQQAGDHRRRRRRWPAAKGWCSSPSAADTCRRW